MMKDIPTYLKRKVLGDGETVTYRALSREFDIHVDTAKQHLNDFYSKYKDDTDVSLSATWYLSGVLCSTEKKDPNAMEVDGTGSTMDSSSKAEGLQRIGVFLVKGSDLEEKSKAFTNVTSQHIHALHPAPLNDLRVLSVANLSLVTEERYRKSWTEDFGAKYGVIMDTNMEYSDKPRTVQKAKAEEVKPKVTEEKKKEGKKKEEKPSLKQGTKRKSVGVDEEEQKSAKPQEKGKGKASKIAPDKEDGPAAKKRGNRNFTEDEDEVIESEKVTTKNRRKKPLDSDVEMEDMKPQKGDARSTKEDHMDSALSEEKLDTRGKGGAKVSKSRPSKTVVTSDDDGEAPMAERKDRKRVRKTRMVARKEKTKNEKGYTVTRTVDVEESYSDWESSDDPAKKKKGSAKRKKKVDSDGGDKPKGKKKTSKATTSESEDIAPKKKILKRRKSTGSSSESDDDPSTTSKSRSKRLELTSEDEEERPKKKGREGSSSSSSEEEEKPRRKAKKKSLPESDEEEEDKPKKKPKKSSTTEDEEEAPKKKEKKTVGEEEKKKKKEVGKKADKNGQMSLGSFFKVKTS
ncbi:hypothetical protein BT69DRAFT_257389 [Atractiella rhizophila]|nr:hypothetical protein BT69DRAFT_257389 [Atractiella rhizophila]